MSASPYARVLADCNDLVLLVGTLQQFLQQLTGRDVIDRAPSAAAEPISCSNLLVVASRSINT